MPGPPPGHSYLRLSVPSGTHRKLKAVASARGLTIADLVSELVATLPDTIHFKELELSAQTIDA